MSKPKPKARPVAAKKPAPKASKPAPKAAQKPAPKAAAKPALKPAVKPSVKPAPAAATKSSAKPAAKPAPAAAPAAKSSGKPDPTASILESAQNIWLAGLGAFGKAQVEGGKLYQGLVKEGSALEQKTRKIAGSAVDEVRGAVANSVTQVRERTQDTWARLEQMFDARLTAALSKIGVPSRKDLDELTKRIEELSKDMRKHSIGVGVKTGFGNVMTTQTRRARDDLSDLARELEEAQLAAKQAEKKSGRK
jgi:poly(hydroxyalkanoate) granule-associated protein